MISTLHIRKGVVICIESIKLLVQCAISKQIKQ